MQYQLNMPGRGEIFPALAAVHAADYWPVAVLSIANTSDKAVLQIISSEVRGWSAELRQTAVIGPHEVRTFNLDPELLPKSYENGGFIRHAGSRSSGSPPGHTFAQQRPSLYSASDFFWGRKFANAQLLARWVTPHDDKVLQLVARLSGCSGGRCAVTTLLPGVDLSAQVRRRLRLFSGHAPLRHQLRAVSIPLGVILTRRSAFVCRVKLLS
jgi:hypothetical protein